jgi:DEAD/DEAH box helicase domain-containing protein
MKQDPLETITRVAQRTTSAVVARVGTKSSALRAYLASAMGGIGQPASFIQEPLIESAHGFFQATETMSDLAGNLLRPELVDALDGGDGAKLADRERNRFGRDWHPFRHQVAAWRELLDAAPKSVMVTSGTGSGKTECFLVPLLNSLVEQAAAGRTMIGVQAIMLYPLNALINSQRERLSDWTAPFGGKIRFALYNGATPDEEKESVRRNRPEEVLDRKRLRESPPPILVTNITMLEYMLIRFEDNPILQASQGKLRYIILDEAHTYVGSQAAELSLLLRRVLFAFGVEPKNVRFVATSATIGKQGDPETKTGLLKFLAQVAGVPESQVVVIEGERKIPSLPPARSGARLPEAEELASLKPEALFDRLGSTPSYVNGFRKISHQALTFKGWCDAIGANGPEVGKAVLEAGTRAAKNGERLLPLRVHAFHRSQGGVWACLNPDCPGRRGTLLDEPSWSFGSVHLERSDLCPDCSSPMLEVKYCGLCEQVSLAAQKNPDQQGRQWLSQIPNKDDEDDFSELETVDATDAEEGDEETNGDDQPSASQTFDQVSREVLIAPATAIYGSSQCVDARSGEILDAPRPGTSQFCLHTPLFCPHCNATFSSHAVRLFSIRLGGPFLLGSIVPELLDDAFEAPVPITDGEPDNRLRPADGRQLLMFTDSRQGTARLAAKLQRDAEQAYVRAFIYHTLQASRGIDDAAVKSAIQTEIEALRSCENGISVLRDMRIAKERELEALSLPVPKAWDRMITSVVNDERINRFIRERVWVEREPDFSNATRFAQFLLLREFLRQPIRANSAETMGLATLRFSHFDDIRDDQVPGRFTDRGGSAQDWRDFLYIAMTKFARQNWCVAIDRNILHWISHKRGSLKIIKPPGQNFDRKREQAWPGQCKPNDKRQVVRLLAQGLGLSLDDAKDRDDIDECLSRSWQQFQGVCEQVEGGFRLDFQKASLAPVTESYACPVVNGLLRDRTFRDLSPVAKTPQSAFLPATKVKLPTLPYPFHEKAGEPVDSSRVAEWLNSDLDVQNLRRLGIWSDLHDRIAQYSVYFRAAEHSAQQSGRRLKEYEREFKAGRINVLSCSTTMEMGVDIGSISTVAMSNVPPSIASYRQRVGRAGRRGQAMALSLTLCKDRAIDRSVFRDPIAFLDRTIYAPAVALDSAVIAQRHVNATLLARFLAENSAELHKVTAGPFFGFKNDGNPVDPGESLSEKFANWLDSDSLRNDANLRVELSRLLAGTAIDGGHLAVIDETRDAIRRIREAFANEWEAIRYDIVSIKDTGARKSALDMQMRRLVGEFLLSDLSGRGFLPGYGFPTDVVNFDNTLFAQQDQGAANQGDRQVDGADRRNQLRDTPSRQLDLAIRDYAPGSDVVVDGRVYRSAGLRLAWKRPVTEESAESIQSLGTAWRCRNCGGIGTSHATPNLCPSCGGTNLAAHRFIKPSGFSCDPWEKPHDKIEEVSFVTPKAPWVAAQDGQWVHLTARESGRHRASRSGTVFHYTLGSDGNGYAICLACGRAEPEHAPENEGPPLPNEMVGHRPLRSKKNALRCDSLDAANRPFVIQRHRALGYEITTDVFELQLPGLPSASVALPIAVALRDSLAKKLGVEDAEMGISVAHTMGEDEIGRWSILIYDKAPGGAGFSVTAAAHIEDLLKDAAAILDCPNGAACEGGCPDCVLCRDIESHEGSIQRRAALDFMVSLVGTLGLPRDLAIFGQSTRAETQPLADAVMREMERRPGAELVLWLLGSPNNWDLNRWAALRVAQRLAARDRRVRILIPSETLGGLDQASRVELYGLAIKAGCLLETAPPSTIGMEHRGLVWIGGNGKGLLWASRDKQAWIAAEGWGSSGKDTLLRGDCPGSYPGQAVNPEAFLIAPDRTAILEVNNQLNCRINDFGKAFWNLVGSQLPTLNQRINTKSPLLAIEYSDRYLNSPLPVRLLREVLATAPGIDSSTVVKLTTADQTPSAYASSPRLFKHDWRVQQHRDAVLKGVFDRDFPGKFGLVTKDKRDVSHGRVLRLIYANGATVIHLDQGFGYWSAATPVYFAFSAGILDQIVELRRSMFQVRPTANFASWIVVNDENCTVAQARTRAY